MADTIPFPIAIIERGRIDPLEHAAQRIHESVSDLLIELHEAETLAEIERIYTLLGQLAVEVTAAQDCAADRLDRVSKGRT